MYVYDRIWQNKFNRTIIFSTLMTFWTLFIELYILFWPVESVKENILLGFLYTDIFGFTPLVDVFHSIVWALCFFFGWITYTLIKEISRSQAASINEFIIAVIFLSFFIIFINNITVTVLFLILVIGEFSYMYYSLKE